VVSNIIVSILETILTSDRLSSSETSFSGNHETSSMNQMYGFEGEVKSKYPFFSMALISWCMCEYILPLNYLWLKNFLTVQIYSSDMVELFTEVYNWLPLAHLINNKVMVGNVVLLSEIFFILHSPS
jgi:serine/threonine-protein phosphatase 5